MDQTNPLSEITQKRRVSALGPGGLLGTSWLEVIERSSNSLWKNMSDWNTGSPNIGLINSLATYCRVNKFGYIESPYKSY